MPYSKQPLRICTNCDKEFHCRTNSKLCDACRKPIKKTCVACGKSFYYRPSLKANSKTCSYVCSAKYRWRNVLKERSERRQPCANCGKPITRKNIAYGKRKTKHLFCNTKCYGAWRSNNISGDFHPRYKGGYDGYYGKSWNVQRSAARKRDKVCQRCGKTPIENGKALDVHHIIPFEKFGIDREQDAHKLNNLICYCKSCHQLLEWELSKS